MSAHPETPRRAALDEHEVIVRTVSRLLEGEADDVERTAFAEWVAARGLWPDVGEHLAEHLLGTRTELEEEARDVQRRLVAVLWPWWDTLDLVLYAAVGAAIALAVCR